MTTPTPFPTPTMTAASGAVGPLLGAAAKPARAEFDPSILIFVVIGAAFYFLIYRPQQQQAEGGPGAGQRRSRSATRS